MDETQSHAAQLRERFGIVPLAAHEIFLYRTEAGREWWCWICHCGQSANCFEAATLAVSHFLWHLSNECACLADSALKIKL